MLEQFKRVTRVRKKVIPLPEAIEQVRSSHRGPDICDQSGDALAAVAHVEEMRLAEAEQLRDKVTLSLSPGVQVDRNWKLLG